MDRDIAKICRTKEELLQYVTKGNYKRQVIINEELVIVFLQQSHVYFNKPFYIGFSILDISKTLMTDMFYNILKKYYENDICMLYTDTDSFILRVIIPLVFILIINFTLLEIGLQCMVYFPVLLFFK